MTSPIDSLRIVSLIPSATEIVASLGLTDALVGVSHECDLDGLQDRPVCTEPKFNPEGDSATRVYGVDGNQYFNRPGPWLVDSLEILAELVHPECCQYGYEGRGWSRI